MNKIIILPFTLAFLHLLYVAVAIVYSELKSKNSHNKNKIKTDNAAPGNNIEIKKYSIEHITCFKNETAFIKDKLENLNKLNTIHEIHHTFVNDNSDDDTLEMLKKYKNENSSIINNTTSLGKNQSQIKAVDQSQSDLIFFTDANVFITDETVNNLVKNFDADIVGVTGNVKITTDLTNQDFSGKYWEIEKKIKEFQSLFGTVIGFDGGLYCVKRENYNLTRENELSDFETAFLIFEQQKKTKYVKEAVAVELEKRTIKNSLRSRIRASNRVFWSFYRIFKYIKELNFFVLLHFFLHKIIRYIAAISLVVFLPFIIVKIYYIFAPLLLIIFIPAVWRGILECVSLFIGGLIALTGKEYTTWTHSKS